MKNVIYKISNKINSKIYIGSAVDFKRRISVHRHHLLKKTHHNILLQNHVNKYGIESICFDVLEFDCANLIPMEQHYIDLLNPFFNIRRIAHNMTGTKRTPEQKAKMSLIQKENVKSNFNFLSNETREKGLKTRRENGPYIRTQETRDKISKSTKGIKKMSDESKEKIRIASTGRRHTLETKTKLSLSKKLELNPNWNKKGILHHNFGKKWKNKTKKETKKVLDTETGIVYDSVLELSKLINVPRSTLNKWVNGYFESKKKYIYL